MDGCISRRLAVLFPGIGYHCGKPLLYVTNCFSKLLRDKGLRHIRLHDLRHSCASLLLKNGVPTKQIQEWLGHSNISTTSNIYAHLDYSSKVLSASTMEGALNLPELNLTMSWE
jgi:Site-specific recombinase XerC